jgi:hypothetical protein
MVTETLQSRRLGVRPRDNRQDLRILECTPQWKFPNTSTVRAQRMPRPPGRLEPRPLNLEMSETRAPAGAK